MAFTPNDIETIRFEAKDTEIFSIPDTKTRLDTLQNYFFPRLEGLLRNTVDLIQEIYGVNPYEQMTIAYRPSHRAKAHRNIDYGEVHIGLRGKWHQPGPLAAIASLLIYTVSPDQGLQVAFEPFRQQVDPSFASAFADLVQDARDDLVPILVLNHIAHNCIILGLFVDVADAFRADVITPIMPLYSVALLSPAYPFPVQDPTLAYLQDAFIALYPLLEAAVAIAHAEPHYLLERLESYRQWYRRSLEKPPATEVDGASAGPLTLPELDSYHMIRPGLWWAVLARDRWTCCSCGRSARQDGVLLEVDHIIPRSHGGTDALENLQTLCKKCNLGKSNRDSTDLRRRGHATLVEEGP
jgi:5-methylcytosine-specific restriction endonuclease McrA